MEYYLVHVFVLGGVYAGLAVGFSLYFGTMRLINLAHGEVFTLGAFAALALSTCLGPMPSSLHLIILFVAAGATGLVLGPTIELVAFRKLRGRKTFALLLTSVAISIVLREGLALVYPNGANPHPFPDPLPHVFYVGGVAVRLSQLACGAVSFVGVIALSIWVYRSSYGRYLRAVSEDPGAAAILGINVDRIMLCSFAVASVLACVTGFLYAAAYGVIRYDMGLLMGLRGFTAAVLGGMRRIEGAIVGGIALAAAELGIAHSLPGGSGYRDAVVFTILIIVLVLLPHGLLGRAAGREGVPLSRRSVAEVAR